MYTYSTCTVQYFRKYSIFVRKYFRKTYLTIYTFVRKYNVVLSYKVRKYESTFVRIVPYFEDTFVDTKVIVVHVALQDVYSCTRTRTWGSRSPLSIHFSWGQHEVHVRVHVALRVASLHFFLPTAKWAKECTPSYVVYPKVPAYSSGAPMQHPFAVDTLTLQMWRELLSKEEKAVGVMPPRSSPLRLVKSASLYLFRP